MWFMYPSPHSQQLPLQGQVVSTGPDQGERFRGRDELVLALSLLLEEEFGQKFSGSIMQSGLIRPLLEPLWKHSWANSRLIQIYTEL